MLIKLNEQQKQLIEEHTLKCYPNEMCGFLTTDSFIPLVNKAKDTEKSFSISALDTARYFSDIIAIVHSHTRELKRQEIFDLRTPSYADFINQKKLPFPWLIVGCEGITVTDPLQFPRVPSQEYIGRRFQWFVNDCYSLVQDFYRFELGIILQDAVITADYEDIRDISGIFLPYIQEYGFIEVKLEEIQEGDLILLDNSGKVDNHLGIYTNGKILHQDMISCIVPFETFLGRIKKVLRYEQ